MKKILFVVICASKLFSGEICDSIVLKAERISEYYYDAKKRKLDKEEKSTSFSGGGIVVSGLNTNSPYIKTNMGGVKVVFVSTISDHFYLLEYTDINNIVVYTIFTDANKFTISKQYSMFGNPYANMVYGSYSCAKP